MKSVNKATEAVQAGRAWVQEAAAVGEAEAGAEAEEAEAGEVADEAGEDAGDRQT